jgi:hypothetical protein
MDLWPLRRLPMGTRLAALWVVGPGYGYKGSMELGSL